MGGRGFRRGTAYLRAAQNFVRNGTADSQARRRVRRRSAARRRTKRRTAYFAAVTIAPPGVEQVGLAEAAGRILAERCRRRRRLPGRSALDDGRLRPDRRRRPQPAPDRGRGADGSRAARSAVRRRGDADPDRRRRAGGCRRGRAGRGHRRDDGCSTSCPTRTSKPARTSPRPGPTCAPATGCCAAGRRIGGPELAVLATLGIVDVAVYRRPRVAILSTGDELVERRRAPRSRSGPRLQPLGDRRIADRARLRTRAAPGRGRYAATLWPRRCTGARRGRRGRADRRILGGRPRPDAAHHRPTRPRPA